MGWFSRKRKSSQLKRGILSEPIDFQNVITSAFHAKELYDTLKVKYHPDRFVDKTLKDKADKLFQQISANKENYNALMLLKEEAERELTLNND